MPNLIKLFSSKKLSLDIRNAAQDFMGGCPKYSTDHVLSFNEDDFEKVGECDLHNFSIKWGLDYGRVKKGWGLRNFSLLAIDMDSTLIDVECIDEMAKIVNRYAEVSSLTFEAIHGREFNYESSIKDRTLMLRGLQTSTFPSFLQNNIRLSKGAESLLNAITYIGLKAIIVSGGFSFVAEFLAANLPISDYFAHELEYAENALTGNIIGSIITADKKIEIVRNYCASMGVGLESVIAVGDGANDFQMLKNSGLGVGVRPKDALRPACSIVLNHFGLDVILLALDEEALFFKFHK